MANETASEKRLVDYVGPPVEGVRCRDRRRWFRDVAKLAALYSETKREDPDPMLALVAVGKRGALSRRQGKPIFGQKNERPSAPAHTS